MENQFLVDSEFLSPEALDRKHRLETDPSARTNHMEYMPDMEVLDSDLLDRVVADMESYDYDSYTAQDVRRALHPG